MSVTSSATAIRAWLSVSLQRRSFLIGQSLLCLLFIGCGSTENGMVPVGGTITLAGQPLAKAEVYFLTDAEGWSTTTDEDGYFQFAGGIKPLKFRVAISKFEGTGMVLDSEAGMDSGQLMAMQMSDPSGKTANAIAKQLLPEKYSSKSKTELTFTVPLDGTQSADFELTM
jgi:hypothetical protein